VPIADIKIDRCFVQAIPDDSDEVAIVLAILALADHMQLRVETEGVERDAQVPFLHAHGCHALEGFLFDRPGPLATWLCRKGWVRPVSI
jgi:EAL domain-containing protein (putative c-di-GMP-specific phosphodiesterase class I)